MDLRVLEYSKHDLNFCFPLLSVCYANFVGTVPQEQIVRKSMEPSSQINIEK